MESSVYILAVGSVKIFEFFFSAKIPPVAMETGKMAAILDFLFFLQLHELPMDFHHLWLKMLLKSRILALQRDIINYLVINTQKNLWKICYIKYKKKHIFATKFHLSQKKRKKSKISLYTANATSKTHILSYKTLKSDGKWQSYK